VRASSAGPSRSRSRTCCGRRRARRKRPHYGEPPFLRRPSRWQLRRGRRSAPPRSLQPEPHQGVGPFPVPTGVKDAPQAKNKPANASDQGERVDPASRPPCDPDRTHTPRRRLTARAISDPAAAWRAQPDSDHFVAARPNPRHPPAGKPQGPLRPSPSPLSPLKTVTIDELEGRRPLILNGNWRTRFPYPAVALAESLVERARHDIGEHHREVPTVSSGLGGIAAVDQEIGAGRVEVSQPLLGLDRRPLPIVNYQPLKRRGLSLVPVAGCGVSATLGSNGSPLGQLTTARI